MKTLFVSLSLAAVALSLSADERAFTASSVPHAKLRKQGKVVISNTSNSINAYHFFGNVREALVALKSKRIAYRPFGAALFNTDAPVPATVSPALQSVIADAARTHGVDPRLVVAVAGRESAFNSNAISPVGACGLMQLMPATARYLGVTNIFDPRDNIFAGTRYLRTLLDTFHGDLDLALAAYNAGPGAVQKYNGIPPYRETQAYVRSVRSRYEAALNLQ